MSRYELRGALCVGEEPDSGAGPYGPTGLSTDYHWEYGYDCGGLTYYAHLYDDVPDDDLEEHERERPLIWIGEASCSVETVEQLQQEMGLTYGQTWRLPFARSATCTLPGSSTNHSKRSNSAGSCCWERSFANTLGVFSL